MSFGGSPPPPEPEEAPPAPEEEIERQTQARRSALRTLRRRGANTTQFSGVRGVTSPANTRAAQPTASGAIFTNRTLGGA